jgi:hypothetical protein
MEADKDLDLEARERDLLAPPFLRLSLYVSYSINLTRVQMEADKDLELEVGERDLLASPFLRLSLYVSYSINLFNAGPDGGR